MDRGRVERGELRGEIDFFQNLPFTIPNEVDLGHNFHSITLNQQREKDGAKSACFSPSIHHFRKHISLHLAQIPMQLICS